MTLHNRRRFGTSLAALVLVAGLASGCTAGDWRYDVPPAEGAVQDAGPVKARNILMVANEEGKGLLLGSLFTDDPVELIGVAVAGQQPDLTFADPVAVELTGPVGVVEPLELGGKNSIVEGTNLQPGLLCRVLLQFDDGTSLTVEAVVVSSEEETYKEVWASAVA